MSVNNQVSLCKSDSLFLRIDGHCDTITALERGTTKHIDLKTAEFYVDLQFFALYIKAEADTLLAVSENNKDYRYYQEVLEKYDKIVPILCNNDLKKIGIGKIGSLLAIENSEPLAEDSEALGRLIEKGYRSFGITWSNENSLAGGANTDIGLKPLGRDIIKAMNREKVLVDLAHMSEKSFYDTMNILEKPPIVTHSCCYGLCHHKRNLKDDALKLLCEAKGVLGITFVRSFLSDDNRATVDRIVDHLLYAADILGIDGVAIGSDFDGTDLPLDMECQKDIEKLWLAMAERGFSKSEIEKIRGKNLQNFLEKTLGEANEV